MNADRADFTYRGGAEHWWQRLSGQGSTLSAGSSIGPVYSMLGAMVRLLLPVLVLALPVTAFADIGHVVVLEGGATRTPSGGSPVPLAVDTSIELNDTLSVDPGGQVKLELNDGSSLMLSGGTRMLIDEATFEGAERKGFSAKLLFGSVWANVKKALSGTTAKFEVSSPRAVAGVRGTTFTIEVGDLAADYETHVGVEEGEVDVAQLEEEPGLSDEERARDQWAVFRRVKRLQRLERIKAGQALRMKRAQIAREKFRGGNPTFRKFILKNKMKRLKNRQQALERLRRQQERGRQQMERLRQQNQRRP